MKCKVKLLTAGKIHYEYMICNGYEEAKKIALSRNPFSVVVSTNALM